MKSTIRNIKITRGDSVGFFFVIQDLDIDLASAKFTVKENADTEEILFQKTLLNGIRKIDNENYYIKLDPADTEDFFVGDYFYDLEIKIGTGLDTFTLAKGKFIVDWDISKGGQANE